jgi:hypothetical protein
VSLRKVFLIACAISLNQSESFGNSKVSSYFKSKQVTAHPTLLQPQQAKCCNRVETQDIFFRPLFWQHTHRNQREDYFLYPLSRVSYREKEFQWFTFLGLWHYHRQFDQKKMYACTFVPFYFSKKGMSEGDDYEAIFPLGGRVRNFLGRDSMEWFLWPLWVKTIRNDNVQYWCPWPFINRRCGSSGEGFALWPLGGHFCRRDRYEERYCLWPLIYERIYKQPDRVVQKGFLPFFAYEKTARVEDLSIIWPLWGHRWETNPHYEERRILWPLWVQGNGEQKCIHRWAPFHTYSENKVHHISKEWFAWPFIKQMDWNEKGLKIHQEQCMYFLFWQQTQTNVDKNFLALKTHFWPIYSYWDNGQGHRQMQMLSLFEVFFPNNIAVQRIYNPIFALYRFEEQGHSRRQSLLFRLIQEEKTPSLKRFQICFILDYLNTENDKKFSLLKGLLGYHKSGNQKTVSFLWKQFKSIDYRKKRILHPKTL